MQRYIHSSQGWALADAFAAIAAVVSVVFAGLTYFWSYHKTTKPFEPSISAGTPLLRETQGVLSIVLSAPITNNGDEPGCIADLGLRVQSKTAKTRWSFFPAWRVDMERYLKAAATREDPFAAIQGPLSPAKIPGKSTHQQVVLFLPRSAANPKLEPLRLRDLTPRETYVVSVYALQGDTNCEITSASKYVAHANTEFVLEQHHIADLAKGTAIVPLDTIRDVLREQFVSAAN